jgi:redox-sensitive bicupin YhaK (pirin superfamily)
MDRKKFIKRGLAGLAAASAVPLVANSINDATSSKEQVGFNHLPNKEERTMKSVLHKADTRGHANHGWLDTHHTFSFANYYNPERMNFGALRVLNDDIVDGGRGFGRHPHDNMEIISIPLEGALEHKDSMGNSHAISRGDVQVMSAGTGVFHSEYNKEKTKNVNFLQIWVFPNKRNVKPRYDQITLDNNQTRNKLYQVLSPNPDDAGVWAHQDAWFHMGKLDAGFRETYKINRSGNGLYTFVLQGNVTVGNQKLGKRDGFGVWDMSQVDIKADSNAEVLLMEVPMTV